MDAAFDDGSVSKKLAIIIAPLLAVLGAYAMYVDAVSATILMAVVLGVLFTGKIDNLAHILATVVIFPIIYFAGIEFLLVPLVVLVLSGMIDEFGNDFIDKRKDKLDMSRISSKVVLLFFEQRWTLKITIMVIVFIGLFPWYFFVSMLLFDYAYLSVSYYSDIKMGVRRPVSIRNALASFVLIFK